MNERPILIIGGNGKTGRRVDEQLRAMGMATRPVSRSSAIPFDWLKPETWSAALAGVKQAYVTFQPDLAVEGSTEAIAELGRKALDEGLEHVVLLSGRGEPGAQRAEAALQMSGLQWTSVRASWFNQNFSEGYLLDAIIAGEVVLPAGPVPEPFVDTRDIADVVVAALTDLQHRNKLYEVTGPRSLTFAQAVAEIAAAVGRSMRYNQVPPSDFAEGMRSAGEPEDIVHLLNDLFTVVLDGRNSNTADGVERALSRPPIDFREFAQAIAATGVWDARPR